jgi:hypothetical protein
MRVESNHHHTVRPKIVRITAVKLPAAWRVDAALLEEGADELDGRLAGPGAELLG